MQIKILYSHLISEKQTDKPRHIFVHWVALNECGENEKFCCLGVPININTKKNYFFLQKH